ncbi:hypothetical protein [Ruegeria sp. HKCCSA071]|uniref:hypothetical protein n=1 Tax=Ruegeria sp. HKCCSA071 TaxID=2794834 RepID=UPI001AE6E37B|nr:hypothetical protein [Ruegeria sp. HKCCSA071]
MNDQSPSPAPLSDEELRETLDMVGTVLASVSDRVDDQTRVLDRVHKTATEARQAAFAAQTQTDPEHYGDLVGHAINARVRGSLEAISQVADALGAQSRHTDAVLKKAEQDKWEVFKDIREQEREIECSKTRLSWFGLGVVVLALTMTVTLPRFSAYNSTTCGVFGGVWTQTMDGYPACVHYQD